jgi:hypothetical protein
MYTLKRVILWSDILDIRRFDWGSVVAGIATQGFGARVIIPLIGRSLRFGLEPLLLTGDSTMKLMRERKRGLHSGSERPPPRLTCTFNVVAPTTPAEAAVIVVAPVPVLVARPALSMMATPATEELHTTELEISCVVLSSKLPVAVNC